MAKVNPWLAHVKVVAAQNPELKYKDVLVKAKDTYTPVVKADPVKSKKSRKPSKKSGKKKSSKKKSGKKSKSSSKKN